MKAVAIRGAVTVENNDAEEIKSATVEMVKNILDNNGLANRAH